jgi:uncharacterized delta-60 repeat protein
MWASMTTRNIARRNPRARRTLAVVVALLVALVPGPVRAADGDLDPTFGDAGRVVATYPNGAGANDVAIQPDGKIVVAGWVGARFTVARYLPGGTLDPAFGTDGLVKTTIGDLGDEARAVALLPDGRIVATGTSNRERVIVIRYLEDGTLDSSFSGDGIAGTPRSAHLWSGEDLAIQPNGRIVVVGSGQEGVKYEFAAARFLANGKRDRTFSNDGMVLTPFDWGAALSVALQPGGKIVAAGFHSRGLALVRYLPDGSLDRTFGDRGRVGFWDVPSPPWAIFALAVAIQPNGRIVAAGDYDIFHLGIARLMPDGRLDPSFGGDGVVRTHVKGSQQALSALALEPGGRILAAGYAGPHEITDDVVPRFVAVRYRWDGSLDDSWGGNGKVATFFPGWARGAGAALQPDGNLVVVGSIGLNGDEGFALARYLT